MAKKNVAVIDFGSSKILTLIGSKSVNGTFDVQGYSVVPYGGYMAGEILEPDKLPEVLLAGITTAQNNAQGKISTIYVGVPAEFCVIKMKTVVKNFTKKQRITDDVLDDLFALADDFVSNPTHVVINRSPICFELADGQRLVDPKGMVTTSIKANLSFVLAEREFVSNVTTLLKNIGITNVYCISESLAESMYLFEPSVRDNCAVLVDCGYLTTSVSVVLGDGLVMLKSFSLGGGHLVADLSEYLKIPFNIAGEVKKYASLAGEPNEQDEVYVPYREETYHFSERAIYEITQHKVKQIAKMISKCLAGCEYLMDSEYVVNITGGGISYIKGVAEALNEMLGVEVRIINPNVPQLKEPKNSALIGLLDYATNQHVTSSLFGKLFKK